MTDQETVTPAIERDIVDAMSSFEHDLQLYEEPPEGLLNFEDLEKLVVDRLAILNIVEKIVETSQFKSAKSRRKILTNKLRTAGYETFANLFEGSGCKIVNAKERYTARRMDHISHFLLLLGMSQSSSSRWWIWKMEGFLFEWRLSALLDREIKTLAANNYLKYPMVNENDKKHMKVWLKPLMKHPSLFDSTAFYRVPAIEMLRSEARWYIYVNEGIAYTEQTHLRAVILYQYKSRLRSRIQRLIGAHNYMIDPRTRIVVETVQKKFVTMGSTAFNPVVANVDKLDEVAETYYPPCMRNLHEGLRKMHHLRNRGRVQYTLFLKAIGITAEDAIEMYKKEFTEKIDEAAFEKEYTYIFRHLYGLVGSKKVHDVPSCSQMASDNPGPDEYHGCPLATQDIEDLDKLLNGWNIEPSSKYEIVGAVKKKDRGKACARYFTAIHTRTAPGPILNPKDFYQYCTNLCDSRDSVQPDAAPTKPDDIKSDGADSSEQSASSEENDDSDDDCMIIEEINVPIVVGKYKNWTRAKRTAEARKELVEFYKNVFEHEEPMKVDKAASGNILFTKSGKRDRSGSRYVGGIKSGSSNVADEWSCLDYILQCFDSPEGKMRPID